MAVKIHEESKEEELYLQQTGQNAWLHLSSPKAQRCLLPEEEFTCSVDLRGIINCFLRFLFPKSTRGFVLDPQTELQTMYSEKKKFVSMLLTCFV